MNKWDLGMILGSLWFIAILVAIALTKLDEILRKLNKKGGGNV